MAQKRCANDECRELTDEDDLCPCEDFCLDCHESGISSSCEENIELAEEEARELEEDG